MFSNCDQKKPLIISSNPNHWPKQSMQSNNRAGDAKTFNNNMIVVPSLPSAGVLGLMNKTAQLQQQPQPQPQQPLKCPRCESSNTKFCYYNNYSLSQPRHFCKACKRYWTRGGTLRNVPVGGGCRKNKRVKRPSATSTTVSSSSSLDVSSNSTTSQSTAIPNPQMNHLSSNGYANPLLYGLSDVSGGNNLPMLSSRFSNLKSFENGFGFNGLSDLGLGFPNIDEQMSNSNAATNKTFLSGLYGSLTSSSTPSMAALLATSTFPPHKLINGDDHIPRNSEILGQNRLQSLASLQDFHVGGNYNNDTAIAMNKEGKLDHQISGYIGLLSDPSNFNSNVGGAWLDPTTNVGSSLTSLI